VTVKEKAYAKINLYLDVVGRREDGFHNIRSVMQTVSLSDTLTVDAVESDKTEITLSVGESFSLPLGEDNLIVRAARAYLSYAEITARVSVLLEKRIPVSAGLAGGSADAAATLRALNRMFDNRLSPSRLYSLALTLGSDVPFCLYGGTAFCEGRGEQISHISSAHKLSLVIAKGDELVSTPKAYGVLDRIYDGFSDGASHAGGLLSELENYIGGGKMPTMLYNIFEETVDSASEVNNVKSILAEHGAVLTLMSGSGPSVFGVFDGNSNRSSAVASLRACGYFAVEAESVKI
jgi:4-diphosphocytidyl-2-C-methyl-D-erythritol kinase